MSVLWTTDGLIVLASVLTVLSVLVQERTRRRVKRHREGKL